MKRVLLQDKSVFFTTMLTAIEKQERLREVTEENVLQRTEKMIVFLKDSLSELRIFIEKNEFLDEQEEIDFYKKQLPSILQHIIYYVKIYSLELRLLVLDQRAMKRLLKSEIKDIDKWVLRNEGFYRYYKSGSVEFDHKYFRRSSKDLHLITDPGQWLLDDSFITVPAYLVGELLGHQRYREYLQQELRFFENNKNSSSTADNEGDGLVWTATKMAAVELLYGLFSSAVYNNGNAQLRQIAKRVEKLTGVDLGNYYRYWLDAKYKKIRHQFLQSMIDSSEKRMNEQDENPR